MPPESNQNPHIPFMREALDLARRGGSWVSPNPMVGAVVVKDGNVVGRGWHQRFGGPHAEVFALQEAGEAARGATLYCTLEPCTHQGKTPPCAPEVIRAGISTVVLGARDPNPKAAGGIEQLRQAGMNVVTGVLDQECRRLNAAFFKRVRTGRPLVSLKWAMTLDGRIATASGESKWITGEDARAHCHRLRAEHDAILVGIGTVMKDEPLLTARIGGQIDPAVHQPRRIILDSHARIPLDAPLWNTEGGGDVIVFTSQNAPLERVAALAQRANVVRVKSLSGTLSVPDVLGELTQHGIQSVFVEGGSRVHGSFIDCDCVDQVFAFVSGKIFGGDNSLPPTGGAGARKIADALTLREMNVQAIGADVLIHGAVGDWRWNDE